MVLYGLTGSSGGWAGFERQVFVPQTWQTRMHCSQLCRKSLESDWPPTFLGILGLFMACLRRLHRVSTKLLLFWPTSCFVRPANRLLCLPTILSSLLSRLLSTTCFQLPVQRISPPQVRPPPLLCLNFFPHQKIWTRNFGALAPKKLPKFPHTKSAKAR